MTHRAKLAKWRGTTLLVACGAATLLVLFRASDMQNPADSMGAIEFKSRIERIAGEVTAPEEDLIALFGSRDFVWIYLHAKEYATPAGLQIVERFLADPHVPEGQKEIAVWTMQGLELKEFIKFCDSVLTIHQAGKVTDNILGQALFPAYLWSRPLQEGYQDPEVRRLLLKIKDTVKDSAVDSLLSYYILYIDRILSGEAAREITMDFRARIQQIDESNVFDTYEGSLLNSFTFVEICRQPKEFIGDVRGFLADSQVPERQKEIAVLSMQGLPINDFLLFCNMVIELRKENKIAGWLLGQAIFSSFNVTLPDNYRNPAVRDFLLKIKDSDILADQQSTRDYKEYIDQILSGRVHMRLMEERAIGKIW